MVTDDIFALLSNADRRCILETLSERGPTTVDELATELAVAPSKTPDSGRADAVSRAKISLVHRHLPRLADHNVIAYDGPDGPVSLESVDGLESSLNTTTDYTDRSTPITRKAVTQSQKQ
ncbi:helix-turn-helix transcriptional regulator [Natronolimnobius sp. AArcel1]|uniref:helix-turn-helix transcriptional regulator n=1 Tax=Natronolimnobius sp. AArcel1 TaxID=1679093 RepID=UPI0013EC4111|nr:helix-turn-helix transcriptional regulator [Natronolimnobius sp. AArcel1]NGM68363.1 helix-turn-helix transcriptional regulator [Natronolimnobius sp. AArcel1]